MPDETAVETVQDQSPESVEAKPDETAVETLNVVSLGKVCTLSDGTKVVLVKVNTLARIMKSAKTGKLPSQLTGMGSVNQFCDMLGIADPYPKNTEVLADFIAANVQI